MSNAPIFCDALSVTFPQEERSGVIADLLPFFDESGFESANSDLLVNPSCNGMIHLSDKYGVFRFEAKGPALQQLRDTGVFVSVLATLGLRPHRVTRLDATLDLPIDAPPVLQELYTIARRGKVKLSRKAVPSSNVRRLESPGLDGRDTGTVYLGRRSAEVVLTVYDKRNEIWSRSGVDVGPRLRYEIRLTSKVGVTLRDAFEPAAVFYNFLAPGLLQRPDGLPEWKPGEDLGFVVDRVPGLPYRRLQRRVEGSAELARLVALARECGPDGFKMLVSMMRRYHAPSLQTESA